MTQVSFFVSENPVTAAKLNQAVQGYRFFRRSTFIGQSNPIIFNCHPRAAGLLVRIIGPGGGGAGAAAGGPSDGSAGSGGGSGGYYEFFTTDSDLIRRPLTISAPPGGSGGLAGSPGVTSISSVITFPTPVNPAAILARAGAGTGGLAMTPGQFEGFSTPGTGGTAFNTFATSNDIFMNGESGRVGIRFFNSVVLSGRGGNSIFRGAGGETGGFGAGKPAQSLGSGGGGAAAGQGSAGFAGGRGGDGAVLLDEYY